MKVALVQFNPKVGHVAANVEKAKTFVADAKTFGAELVIFPELALTGYPPRDLLDFPDIVDSNVAALKDLASHCLGIAALCGFVEKNPSLVGKPFFNSAAFLREGVVEAVGRKQLLPYYDVFEEERYFEAGDKALVFELGGLKFGLTICEDAWNFPWFLARTYAIQPLEPLRGKNLDFLINISASPFQLGKPEQRLAVFSNAASFVGAPILVAGQAGGNDELLFDGSTMAMTQEGTVKAFTRPFEERLLVVETSPLKGEIGPLPESSEAWLETALETGLRDYVEKCGAKGVCLGLSGGIDSSVCAAIAVKALGKDRVVGLGLPTRFTTKASLEDAETLANRLGIEYRVFSIDRLFVEIQRELSGWFKTADPVTWENIQPRLRMTVLMALSNQRGLFLLNTSNKSEISTGFSTLYGDSAGALSIIGDVTKTQVYALARFMNQGRELIPARVLTRAPTAELRANQTDQDVLPPYDFLDRFIESIVVKAQPLGAATSAVSSEERPYFEKFLKMHLSSEYKRAQMPSILKVSPRSFGMGRRVPIAASRTQP